MQPDKLAVSAVSFLPVVGADLRVPLVTGNVVRYVNLDYAASAPCLASVWEAVARALPWYSSVHRGAGLPSAVTTAALEAARAGVAAFLGARLDDALIFTRNTTDALNLLAAALPEDTTVVTFASEHHANLLPWRRGRFVHLPVPASPDEALAAAAPALAARTTRHALLSVTGASNVTGELWPIGPLGEVAHQHGARIAVDAAQLAPHRAIDLAALGLDYLALSGHKLYAPFGAGVLVGRADWLDQAAPYLAGGGAVRRVGLEDTEWVSGAARHEAGTPNVLGALALHAACQALAAVGMERVAAHERALLGRLIAGLDDIAGVERLSLFGPTSARVGIVAFNLHGVNHGELASVLSAEHGIGVRDGAFCAHPLLAALSGGAGPEAAGGPPPGAVRASLGVGTSVNDVDRLLCALSSVATRGARWRYRRVAGRTVPDPDPRARPVLGAAGAGEVLSSWPSEATPDGCASLLRFPDLPAVAVPAARPAVALAASSVGG